MLGLGSIFVMAVAIYIGFANKFGFDLNKMHYLFLVDQSYVINYLGWRVATFLHSITYWLSFNYQFDILGIIYEETAYRLSSIFGGHVGLPDIRSMARINYLNIFNDNSHLKSGTTPGLFGGIVSLLNHQIIALLIFSVIGYFLIRLFAFYPPYSLGAMPVIIMAASTYHYFDSIIDLLIFPSPGSFSLLLYVLIIYSIRLRVR